MTRFQPAPARTEVTHTLSSTATPPPPTRCVILSPYADQRGGAEQSLLHALAVGAESGIAWALAVPRDGEIRAAAEARGLTTECYGEGRTRNPASYLRSARALQRLVRVTRAEAILSWNAFPHFRAVGAAVGARVPTVWFQKAGARCDWRGRLHARLPARAVFANSIATARKQDAVQRAARSPRPIYVVPSAVDLREFDPTRAPSKAECRCSLGLPADRPLVALVGRLQAWKGFHVLIDALPAIRSSIPNAELLLVGGVHPTEADYGPSLQRRAEALGVREAVRFIGGVPHTETPRWMQAADLVIHCSIDEPFGIVVIEAMALGKPVVAARSGGPLEVVRDEVDGLLADPTDPRDVARQVTRLLADDGLGRRLGESARGRAELYGLDLFGRRLAWALRRAIDRRDGPGVIVDESLRELSMGGSA